MKLAFLLSTLDDGGAAAIVSQITTHLSDEYEVDIILNSIDNIKFPVTGRIISLGLDSIPQDRTNLLYQIRVFVRRLKLLSKLKMKNEYDACISYMDSANVVNLLTRKSGNKCKSIINVVNNMSASAAVSIKYKYIVNPFIRKLYNKADGIIAQTRDIKEDLVEHYALNSNIIHVNYSAIDIDKIDGIIANQDKSSDKFTKKWIDKNSTVITAGRFTRQKGHGHLIRAFSEVVKEIPNAKLVIFGKGELENYYKKLIDNYGLGNNVVLHDFDPYYCWYISRSAIFAFPSVHEGFGMALQDAMACNVACVAADYRTGARELLSDDYDGAIDDIYYGEYGIITRATNEELYDADKELDASEISHAKAIIQLLHDKGLREKLAQRARVKAKKYDIQEITCEWEYIIGGICGN